MDGPWGNETAAQLQRLVDQVAADDSEGAQQVQVPDRDGTAGAVQLKGLTLPSVGERRRGAAAAGAWLLLPQQQRRRQPPTHSERGRKGSASSGT